MLFPISMFACRESNIDPCITQDVEMFEECLLDEMLMELLANCTNDTQGQWSDKSSRFHLFEECLKKVLPICNGEAQAQNKTIKAKSCQVKDNLEA